MIGQGEQIGGYRVLHKLGQGGMGAVFEAVHGEIARRAAIKVLHPQYSQDPEIATRFLNEARAANLVDHPGIVEIFEHGRLPDGTTYIVMELLKGQPLQRRLMGAGPVPVAEALQVGRQVASALRAAHAKDIVHRDLKPDNIYLVPDDEAQGGVRAKVLDFGIAKLAEDCQRPDGEHVHTQAHLLLGTPLYMSPEQCQGAAQVTPKSDVYSLGVILYEMLAGGPPFVPQGIGPGSLIIAHMTHEPPPLRERAREVPAEVAALVHRMLAKDPARRPSMAEVLEALSQQGGRTLMQAGVGPAAGAARRPWLWAVPVVGLLVVGLGAWGLRGAPKAGPAAKAGAESAAKAGAESAAKAGPAAAKAGPPTPTAGRWQVQSEPAGAQVVRRGDGVELCPATPCEVVGAAGAALPVELRRTGYVSQAVDLPAAGGPARVVLRIQELL